jgi:hypothetical protein
MSPGQQHPARCQRCRGILPSLQDAFIGSLCAGRRIRSSTRIQPLQHILLGLSPLILPGGAQSRALIRFGSQLPVTHEYHDGTRMLAKDVLEGTKGPVKIELYPACPLTKNPLSGARSRLALSTRAFHRRSTGEASCRSPAFPTFPRWSVIMTRLRRFPTQRPASGGWTA